MVEFLIGEVLAAVSGELVCGRRDLAIRGVSTDSRQIVPGELFIALKGERFDGHLFMETVARGGAAAVIVMEPVAAQEGLTIIRVQDTLTALGDLARAHRRRFQAPVIAVTGSNGKTTTKDLVASVLERGRRVVKTEKNFNNEIGLPLTLFRMSAVTEATVVEMGMRGLGQIRQLAAIAEPTVAVVTNVGFSHLEILQSQENIARAKGELVEALTGEALAILNGDDPYVRAMAGKTAARSVFYGIDSAGLDYQASAIQSTESGSRFTVRTPEDTLEIELPLPGRHNIMNALAAVAVARRVGLSNGQIQAGLAAPEMTGKRLNIMEHDGGRVIDDTYNASPSSLQAALDVLASMKTRNRKVAVLADMLELGPEAGRLHREMGAYAATAGVDRLFAFGDLAREYVAGFTTIRAGAGIYCEDKTELISQLNRWVEPGDDILIKGSRGMKMEEVVAALTKERE